VSHQAQPTINQADVLNVVFAARRMLPHLVSADLLNVSVSIANLEAAYAPKEPPKPAEPKLEQPNGG
jgi:hypothetical protein